MSDDKENNGEMLHCSFCGKSQAEVKKLVAGRGVYICDECIEVCINIVAVRPAAVKPCWRRRWLKFWMCRLPFRTRRR